MPGGRKVKLERRSASYKLWWVMLVMDESRKSYFSLGKADIYRDELVGKEPVRLRRCSTWLEYCKLF